MTARTPVQTRSRTIVGNNNPVFEPRSLRFNSDSSSDTYLMSLDDPNDAISMEIENLKAEVDRLRQLNGTQNEQLSILRRQIAQTRVGEGGEIENLRSEVDRLRQLNGTQDEQLTILRRQVAQPRGSDVVDNRFINTLVDSLRSLNIESKIPIFSDSQNPHIFLEKLDKFYKLKHVSNINRLDFLDEAFEGRAKIWHETQNYENYDDFKQKFLEEFFSIPVRVRVKSKWFAKRFDPANDQLNKYFLNQVKDAQYFIPKMDNYELHYIIIQQLPIRIREIMATVDFNDFNKISQCLSQLDLTFTDKQNPSKKLAQGSNDNNHSRGIENRNFISKSYERGFASGSQSRSSGEGRGNITARVAGTHVSGDEPFERVTLPTGTNCANGNQLLPLPNVSLPPPSNSNSPSALQGSDYSDVSVDDLN